MKISCGGMMGLLVSTVIISSTLPVAAELPMLDHRPWLGYFAVFANRDVQFAMTNYGKITLLAVADGEPVAKDLVVPIEVVVEELLSNNKTIVKQLKPRTLESSQPATQKLDKVVVRGKVTGDATFELTMEQNRGVIALGGRIVDPGKLKNPLRFSLRLRFPAPYGEKELLEKRNLKGVNKKIDRDRIELVWTDKTRKKQPLHQAVTAASPELNGPGIASAEVQISAYKGKNFLLGATAPSAFTLTNASHAPLDQGFTVQWTPPTDKDPEGKTRLTLQID